MGLRRKLMSYQFFVMLKLLSLFSHTKERFLNLLAPSKYVFFYFSYQLFSPHSMLHLSSILLDETLFMQFYWICCCCSMLHLFIILNTMYFASTMMWFYFESWSSRDLVCINCCFTHNSLYLLDTQHLDYCSFIEKFAHISFSVPIIIIHIGKK